MQNNIIKLTKPTLGLNELKAVKKVFRSSYLGLGKKVKDFEKKFANFIGTKYAVGLNSCTAALDLSLRINNFPKGKRVLVPAITFSASCAVILQNNLNPVFVDINNKNLNLSFEDLKKKYDKNCVALIIVHFAGHPCEMDKIIPWCKKKNIIVIEDCAHTCGGEYKGKKLGSWGDYGCFSFEEKKIMTTGDGGMICTDKKEKLNLIRSLSYHGQNRDPWERNLIQKNKTWFYKIINLGFKYNMNNLQAAIGLEQLKKVNTFNKLRIDILKKYISQIKKLSFVSLAIDYSLSKSSYWLFILRVSNRDKLIKYLKTKKIYASVQLMPLPLHPLYKKYNKKVYNSLKVWKELVSLPFHPKIKIKEIKHIVDSLKSFYIK